MKADLTIHRRTILAGVAAWGTVTFLPYAARAGTHASDAFSSQNGVVEVFPISHFPCLICHENAFWCHI